MKKFLFSVALLVFVALEVWAADVDGLDTVAGQSTVLRAEGVTVGEEVIFKVKNPLGIDYELSGVANDNGVVIENFSGSETQVAGRYEVKVGEEVSFFEVLPGKTDVQSSFVRPLRQVVSSGQDGELEVFVADEYGNAIGSRLIKLVASDGDAQSQITNERGVASFVIESRGQRLESFKLFDPVEEVFLDEEVAVVFEGAVGSSASIGLVDHFSFEDVPSSVGVGEAVSLKVVAEDFTNNKVEDYEGEIRFFVEGDNSDYVILPEDYQFKDTDLGEHVFSLAFVFQREGLYSLRVVDTDNLSVVGQQDILVSSDSGSQQNNNSGFYLTSPSAGIYGSSNQLIKGVAPAGARVKIFDNDVEVGSVVADINGVFNFTGNLSDGAHNIYAAQVNGDGTIVAVSEVVRIEINASAVGISGVEIIPDEILPASAVVVRLQPESAISRAYMIANNNQVDFALTSQGVYEGAFAAPIEFGEYPVDIVLIDALGNESRYDDYVSFRVGVDTSNPQTVKLANVTGLAASPEDKRVILEWDPVAGDHVAKYRVYYGIAPDLLTEAVDTLTNAATWYVPNLINGSDYYFAVVALDGDGNTSANLSNIVSARPRPSVFDDVLVEDPDISQVIGGNDLASDALNDLDTEVSDVGPEVLWLIALSLLAGNCYLLIRNDG